MRGHWFDGYVEVGVLFFETFEKGPHLGDNAVWRLPRQKADVHLRLCPVRHLVDLVAPFNFPRLDNRLTVIELPRE